MAYPAILETKFSVKSRMRCDGAGGMVLALSPEGQRVAVRWFAPDTGGLDALAALGKLPAHPALPRVVGFGQEPSCVWAAIEHPDGELLDVRQLSPEQLQTVAQKVASGLALLHAAGVVHGELASDSVVLRADGEPLIFDVGAAVANRATERRGETRALASLSRTAAFLAPERARGGAMTTQADVYALGAVLCGAACSTSALTTLHEVMSGAVRLEPPAGLSAPLRALVAQMVAANADERPGAAEVAAAFAPAADPFQALLQEKEVSAKGMAPGHEPTLQDPVPPAPTLLEFPMVPAPERRSGPKTILVPQLQAPVAKPAPEPLQWTRSLAVRPSKPVLKPVRRPGPLTWLAASNSRLGAVVAAALVSIGLTLMTLGEYQHRTAALELQRQETAHGR